MQIVMLYSTRTRKAKTQKTGSDLRDVIMILLFFSLTVLIFYNFRSWPTYKSDYIEFNFQWNFQSSRGAKVELYWRYYTSIFSQI